MQTNTQETTSLFATWFTAHPASVGESYFGHARFALGFCFWLLVAAGAALVHAAVPRLCETTASTILRRLVAKMDARH
ncbi:MAG: DUF6356 family protein [Pseudomonadota bacterium]